MGSKKFSERKLKAKKSANFLVLRNLHWLPTCLLVTLQKIVFEPLSEICGEILAVGHISTFCKF
jgi:hypothetical protein